MKTIFSATFTLLGALCATVHAENLTIHIPFTFEAAGKSLPAGDYTVETVGTGLLVMRGASAAETVTIVASPEGITDAANPSVSFATSPDLAVLSRIRMDGGMTFAVRPTRHLPAAAVLPGKGSVALARP